MHRNLDLVSLRTLVAVAESGGMTRAANLLHMTQSAVSMQMKRLEEQLSVQLLQRDGRKVVATVEGDRLISYARRLLDINNEAIRSLSEPLYDTSITCGVSNDIVHPYMSQIVQGLHGSHPRLGVNIECDFSYFLRRGLKNGVYDVIFTTELAAAEGGEALMRQRLVWMTKPGGVCWQKRPLPIALSHNCMFRKPALEALDKAGLAWVDVTQSMNDTSALVRASADLGLRAELEQGCYNGIAAIEHDGALPALPDYNVVMYFAPSINRDIVGDFAHIARKVFGSAQVCDSVNVIGTSEETI